MAAKETFLLDLRDAGLSAHCAPLRSFADIRYPLE